MSEKIYSLLFRLFPSRFRARWHEEALELFRDRAGYERGFVARLRMWVDILCDFAVSLPLAYLRDRQALVPAAPVARHDVPSFTMLEGKPIHASSYFYGTILSIAILMVMSFLAKHGGHFPILRPSSAAEASGVTVDPWATGTASGDGSTLVIGNGPGSTGTSQSATNKPPNAVVHLASTQHPVPPLAFFDAAERHRVLQGVESDLNQHYADPAFAKNLSTTLQARERSGDYDSVDDPRAFAALLTSQLRTAGRAPTLK
jgi:hypothetical protein